MKLTHRDKAALIILRARHLKYPGNTNFAAGHLGGSTAAILRKLEPLVEIHRPAPNRFFYSLTDAGMTTAEEAVAERLARLAKGGDA